MRPAVFSSSYFPPIPWFTAALRHTHIILDLHEHYTKQTWRNRCTIITANGLMNLVIPVKHAGNHTPVKDILLDYATNWQRVHWHAIRSAYGKSPFFEFYADAFDTLYSCQPRFLHEWNTLCLDLITNCAKLPLSIGFSAEYCEPSDTISDYRQAFVPGKVYAAAYHPKYLQVFQERHGFRTGLSILDLLFCAGPQSHQLLTSP